MNTINNQLKAIELIEEMLENGATQEELVKRFPDAVEYIEGAVLLNKVFNLDKKVLEERAATYGVK